MEDITYYAFFRGNFLFISKLGAMRKSGSPARIRSSGIPAFKAHVLPLHCRLPTEILGETELFQLHH